MTRYGICTREIYWKEKNYRPGDHIEADKNDMAILVDAGCVVEKVIEVATMKPPENRITRGKKR